jgi:polyhydroxyalkanoate synthesis regulator phasin
MAEPDPQRPTDELQDAPSSGEIADGVGDALRAAVERTLAATADSASGTRQRAQSLLDDVVRRSQDARGEVARRGEEASNRLADAIGELRRADSEEVRELRARVALLEARLIALETKSHPQVEGETTPGKPLGQEGPSG